MKLLALLNELVDLDAAHAALAASMDISGLSLHSGEIQPGNLFVALAGVNRHGLQYAEEAISNGASAILFDPSGAGAELASHLSGILKLAANNLPTIVGELGARFYAYPSAKLDVIGITGTNGKTSCSHFLGQLLNDSGIIGTLGWGEWGALNKSLNTTPDALTVHKLLAHFVKNNKRAVAMEASSHGLEQGRVNGVQFKGAVFTNLSRDHLDYHGDMESYLAAKLKLFQWPGLSYAVVNLDDDYAERVIRAIEDKVVVWGVSAQGRSLANPAGESITADDVHPSLAGLRFTVKWRSQSCEIEAPVYGDFNVINLLCVLAVALARGMALPEAAARLEEIKPVAGRMELCASGNSGFRVFVDYAHTPDALDRVLASLRPHCAHVLWVVFGCGGNRDAGKRPIMGKMAGQWADRIVVTDDNPRFENNEAIAKEVLMGCPKDKTVLIQDRKQAIEHVIAHAGPEDCIVIAGKGHEDYQEIKGVRYPFNDRLIAEAALNKRFAA